MKQRWLRIVIKVCIVFGMLCGVLLLVYVSARLLPREIAIPTIDGAATVASYVLAVFCFLGLEYIALTLFRMMRSLDGDPFVEQNVRSLRRMGITALCVALCGLMTLVFRPVPLAVLAALPIGMCGLFSLVLSGVFEQAVFYKRENDLTV